MRILMKTDVQGARVDVVRASRLPQGVTAPAPLAPRLAAAERSALPPGTSEIVATLRAFDGTPLGEQAFPAVTPTFYDGPGFRFNTPGESADQLEGGRRLLDAQPRLIELPWHDDATYLDWELRCVTAAPERSGQVETTTLGLHALTKPRGDWGRGRDKPLPWAALPDPTRAHLHGRLDDGPELLHGSGDPDDFDIVILGDGFQESEMRMFRARVELLAERILATPPFAAQEKRINLHVIPTISKDSGVDNCPHPEIRKDTYYNVEGGFEGIPSPTFFGTSTQPVIEETIELIADRKRIELVIMLVNTAAYGGRGDPGTRTSFIPIVTDPDIFAGLTLHESAHAIAKLGDEYINLEARKPGEWYPNVVYDDDISHDHVWWKHAVAHPHELDGGQFRAVHRIGDPIDPASGRPLMKPGLERMVGLFWGAGPVKGFFGAAKGDLYGDPRAAGSYRPMARCKMRWLNEPFCRVCAHILESVILGRSLPQPG